MVINRIEDWSGYQIWIKNHLTFTKRKYIDDIVRIINVFHYSY
jgi:hypothetical protein